MIGKFITPTETNMYTSGQTDTLLSQRVSTGTTINGHTLNGNITITASDIVGGGQYPQVESSITGGTITCNTNTYTVLTSVQNGTTITISLGSSLVGYANEYTLLFRTGASIPTIIWPNNITWSSGIPSLLINTKYLVSFLKDFDSTYVVSIQKYS